MPNWRVSSASTLPRTKFECAALRGCEMRAKHDFNLVRRGLGNSARQILASDESDTHIDSKAFHTELRPFYRRGKPIVRLEPIAAQAWGVRRVRPRA
jgi:hypothetical protein